MMNITRREAIAGGLAALAASKLAWAADYPNSPVKLVVPFAPGGPTDIMARFMAKALSDKLGGSFIVDNRAGAGGNIGAGLIAHAKPDGYNLLIHSSALVVNPGLYKSVPYDPYKSFAPIAELGTSPNVFLANPSAGVTTIAELVAKAKADPKAFSYSSPGIGTTPMLSGELLKLDAGISMTHVPYNGAGPAIQAVVGNTTPISCTSLPPARQLIAAGQLKALAVTGAQRWFDLPDVPTMVELGYKDFVTDTFQAFMAPAGTPQPIIDMLSKASLEILHGKEMIDTLHKNGFIVLANGPDGMKKRIDDEVPKWAELIKKAGIQPM
jgi:tripartite-type tricarboxylate transporter receptor subunit TctC